MAEQASQIEVHDNPEEQRFEANVNGHLAVAEYHREGSKIIFTHTEVPSALEGQGIGSKLVKYALDASRAENLVVVPRCPFVSSYIVRHKEYLDLVDPSYRNRLPQQ